MDWLWDIPVYTNLNQVAIEMNKAVVSDKDEYERCDRDRVLAGLVCYLAENYVPAMFKESVLQVVDTYCDKPVEQKDGEK